MWRKWFGVFSFNHLQRQWKESSLPTICFSSSLHPHSPPSLFLLPSTLHPPSPPSLSFSSTNAVESESDAERVLFSYGFGTSVPSTSRRRMQQRSAPTTCCIVVGLDCTYMSDHVFCPQCWFHGLDVFLQCTACKTSLTAGEIELFPQERPGDWRQQDSKIAGRGNHVTSWWHHNEILHGALHVTSWWHHNEILHGVLHVTS